MDSLLVGRLSSILGVPYLPSEGEGVISFSSFIEKLRMEHGDFSVPSYKFKEWFSVDTKIFFDCEDALTACLERALTHSKFKAFTVFFIGRDASTGRWKIVDLKFRNLGKETLKHFIKRFHGQLEPSTMLGLQSSGLENIRCIGYSYEE